MIQEVEAFRNHRNLAHGRVVHKSHQSSADSVTAELQISSAINNSL